MTLIDRIEALAHAKGWHADQRAHQAADRRWLLRTIAYDRVRLYPPDPGGPDWHDVSTADAALWLLLRVSGLPEVTERRVDLLYVVGERTRAESGGFPDLTDEKRLAQLARRLRDEALVLADHWQSEGVGLSTERIRDAGEATPQCDWRTNEHPVRCLCRATWGRPEPRFFYCHEHRPRDGYGDQLAAAIAGDRHWEAPPEHTPRRDSGADGYSPMLWRLIDRWLSRDAGAAWPARLRSDLERALAAALVRAGDTASSSHAAVLQGSRA